MDPSARQTYLETEVLTAPPQKLQLMLVDGAIRFAEKAREHLQAERHDEACEATIRAQQIVSEIVASLNREQNAELAGRIAAVYMFVFRSLVDANLSHDVGKLDDALRVLRTERETWQQVCETVGAAPSEEAPALTPELDPGSPGESGDRTLSGFSLEA